MEQLHRNLGKLNIARDKLDEALRELSQDIYFSSSEVGPEHIDTSGGYFLVANILYAQRKVNSTSTELDWTEKMLPGAVLLDILSIVDRGRVFSRVQPRIIQSKKTRREKLSFPLFLVGWENLCNIAGRELVSVLRQSSRHLV